MDTLEPIKKILFGTVTHVKTSENVVALTFDDGPDPLYTPRLLEILKRYEAKATFFMIGTNARQYPDIVRQVASAGHAVCNHSWDHALFSTLNVRECYHQVRRCQKAIAPYGLRIFRPPKGYQNRLSRVVLFILGFKVVMWDVSVGDYMVKEPQAMADDLALHLRPGSIIDLHDSLWDPLSPENKDRSQTLRAVEILLDKFWNHYQFVTIRDLLKCGSPQKRNWYWSGQR